jgi:aminoglycoside phosphotransferase (APT) family kinase protein
VLKFNDVQRWLKANMPADVANGVIHNDWRFDNLVLSAENPTEIIGVLDWEMATLGDPLMELGGVIAYWNEAGDDRIAQFMRRQPTHLPGMFTRQQVVDYYLEKSGLKCDNWAFYEAYGLFRLAVIIQQIYYRYHHKQTTNPAFKHFWIMANYLGLRARGVIKRAGR